MKWTVVGFWGGHPEQGEATSAYLLEEEDYTLLIDCGSGVLAQLPKYVPISQLDAVILSHFHFDHVADIGPLQYAKHVEKYIGNPKGVLPIYAHQLEPDKFRTLTYEEATKGIPYDLGKALQVGPFTITFLKTEHPAPCAAMAITDERKKIVFTADTSFFPDLIPFAKHADLLVAECSLYKGVDGKPMGHLNAEDVGFIAKQAEVKELLLSHLPHYGNHQELVEQAKVEFKGTLSLAQSGWSWEA
ncbi:hypothetical protein GCM10011391_24250 [Pullulanibacillus camelliae]|uniref:Metallo-beta-lactamase domain-containing protein n=1 Tax=Pullulanibacillus camelliae TaxID=1707096 RepID=A0A8J2YIB4_9BACL|nr:MBL fold metallo-hydrolase [Pullulanibacillus camelliae]GGE44598.1 hypothetical protein GCM10011391_24250 [Pullulanibacillus camelliae]